MLGQVLSGQRDGSKAWYEAFSSFLEEVIALHKVDTCRNVADLNTKALPRHRLMMLLNLLGGWDILRGESIGLNDIAEFEYKQAMKQAVPFASRPHDLRFGEQTSAASMLQPSFACAL